jgi:hypothetical protein
LRHLPEQQSASALQAAAFGWHSGTLQTGSGAQSVSAQSIAPSQSLSRRSVQKSSVAGGPPQSTAHEQESSAGSHKPLPHSGGGGGGARIWAV